jgi:hypothetical protein
LSTEIAPHIVTVIVTSSPNDGFDGLMLADIIAGAAANTKKGADIITPVRTAWRINFFKPLFIVLLLLLIFSSHIYRQQPARPVSVI